MTTINKNNIEAWLLDYSEGQLNEQELALLEAFLAENPEYRQWLSDFEPVYLPEEESIVFKKKETLLKPAASGRILRFSFVFPRLMAAAALLAAIALLWPRFQNQKINPEMRASLASPEIRLPGTPHAGKEHTLRTQEEKNKKNESIPRHETPGLANRTTLPETKENEQEKEKGREAPFHAEPLQKGMIASIAQNPGYYRYSEIPGWYGSTPVAMKHTLPVQNEERTPPGLMESLLRSEMARAFIPETLEEDLPQADIQNNDGGPVVYLKLPPAGKKIIDKFLNR